MIKQRLVPTLVFAIAIIIAIALVACGGDGTGGAFDNVQNTPSSTIFLGNLNQPAGLAVNKANDAFRDHVFVAEFGSNSIVRISPEGIAAPFGLILNSPINILLLPGKTMLVSESQNNRLVRIDYSGANIVDGFPVTLPAGVFGTSMVPAGLFLYTASRNANRFDSDSIYNVSTNTPVEIATGFTEVSGLAVRSKAGKMEFLLAAKDKGEGRILIVDVPDSVPDTPKEKGFKIFAKNLDQPKSIVIGPRSNFVYVAEGGKGRIIRFSENGELDPDFAVQIGDPVGMAFDSKGALFVSSLNEGIVFKITNLDEGFSP